MVERKKKGLFGRLVHSFGSVLGAALLTLAFFLILPVIQAIAKGSSADLVLQTVDAAALPPPPPMEEEPEQEEEPEEPPPELADEAPPLDLSQLELALNPSFGDGWLEGDFAINLGSIASREEEVDALFSLSDLEQKPRPVYQPMPIQNAKTRKKAPGTVNIIFICDERGRVVNPTVQSSSDPVFEKPALAAIKKWKFEPGKRNGQAVSTRMRVPITFPGGS